MNSCNQMLDKRGWSLNLARFPPKCEICDFFNSIDEKKKYSNTHTHTVITIQCEWIHDLLVWIIALIQNRWFAWKKLFHHHQMDFQWHKTLLFVYQAIHQVFFPGGFQWNSLMWPDISQWNEQQLPVDELLSWILSFVNTIPLSVKSTFNSSVEILQFSSCTKTRFFSEFCDDFKNFWNWCRWWRIGWLMEKKSHRCSNHNNWIFRWSSQSINQTFLFSLSLSLFTTLPLSSSFSHCEHHWNFCSFICCWNLPLQLKWFTCDFFLLQSFPSAFFFFWVLWKWFSFDEFSFFFLTLFFNLHHLNFSSFFQESLFNLNVHFSVNIDTQKKTQLKNTHTHTTRKISQNK